MPTYVYKCPKCRLEVQEKRSFSQADDPLGCPACGAACVRGISTFMFFSRGGATPSDTATATPLANRLHGAGCPCCLPPPRRVP